MYYVMKTDASCVGGAYKLKSCSTRYEANQAQKALDTTLNGRPMGRTYVLDQEAYDQWYEKNIQPSYQEKIQ